MIETMKDLMIRGGAEWVMWILIGLSVLSVGIAIERAWVVLRRSENVGQLVSDLHRLLRSGNLGDALALLKRSKSIEAKVAEAGLAELDQGAKAADEAMAAARGVERARLEERLGFLGTVGNNAPFVGLLGTVIGVVGAFEEMGLAGSTTSGLAPEKVMSAIAEALVATAMGLVVAIPAVAIYNYLQGRITTTIERSETVGHVILSYLEGQTRKTITIREENPETLAVAAEEE